MNITIQLIYITHDIRVSRSGTFHRKGRTQEKIVLDWIREIKKEMDIDQVVSVIIDGEKNITSEIIETLNRIES